MALRYRGGGYIIGIPARDLTDDEVAQHGGAEYLVGTGLYLADPASPAAEPDNDSEEDNYGWV